MPQHFLQALRAPERRKKRGSPQNQGFFNGLKSSPLAIFSAKGLRNVCAGGANSPPARHRREACALWALARSAKRPEGAPKGSACPVGTWAEGPKRPGGLSKYKGCARSARRTPIFARERNERWARSAPSAKIERPGKAGRYESTLEGTEGSVSPVGCCAKRKATRRSQPKRAVGAASARCDD